MRKLLITFAAPSAAALASPNAASAAPPEKFHIAESGTEILLHCDGFDGNLDTTGILTAPPSSTRAASQSNSSFAVA